MLDPSVLTDAIVAALQSNSALVDAMGGDSIRIFAHHYLYGADNRLAQAVYKMKPPSILVVWVGTLGGGTTGFDGATIWKHRFCAYIRAANVAFPADQISYEHIWWLICNGAVLGTTLNIRQINIHPSVWPMDTPTINPTQDEDGMDYFKVDFTVPENGDN